MYNLYTLFIFLLSRLLLNPYYLSTGCRFFYQSDLFSTAEKRFWPRSWGLHSIDVHCTGILQAFQKKKKTWNTKMRGYNISQYVLQKNDEVYVWFFKCFLCSETVQNLPYFWNTKKSHIFFSIFIFCSIKW